MCCRWCITIHRTSHTTHPQVRSTFDADGEGTLISADGPPPLRWSAACDADERARVRAAALAVAGTGARVTVVCREAAGAPWMGEKAARAVRSAAEAAIDASGLRRSRRGPAADEATEVEAAVDGVSVHVDIADAGQIGEAVRAVFDGVVADAASH